MFATIRHYESVDAGRISEVVKKVDEGLAPSLSELPGFRGYYLVDAGEGVLTSTLGAALERAGFHATPRGLRLRA